MCVEDAEGSLPQKVLSFFSCYSLVSLLGKFEKILIKHVVAGFHCFEMQNVCGSRSYI
jgi:hypothetical protein